MPKRLLRTASVQLARGFDQVFARTALNPPKAMRRRSPAESLDHAARMRGLSTIAGFYARPEYLAPDGGGFFGQATAAEPTVKRVRSLGRFGEVVDLRWPSEFQPLWSRAAVTERLSGLSQPERDALMAGHDVGSMLQHLGIDRRGDLPEKYLGVANNRFAHARWYRHTDRPRPVALLIHGYMAGHYLVEERMWPMRALFDQGLDLVLPVLPFHGLRRSEARGFLPPAFPSSDPRFTIEGFRQAIFDLQSLIGYLKTHGAPEVGVMGMSLGGYTSALLSTLDPRVSFAILFIPLASIDAFAHAHGRMIGSEAEQEAQREALARAQSVVSPLVRAPHVRGQDALVIAGEADLVTGVAHGRRLAEHFGAHMETFEGGHLLHFGRSRAFQPAWQMLQRRGLLELPRKADR
jgi:pimeloyl-ACP methyl ester carboxylesterase